MKIKAQHETEAYVSESGYYAIKQQREILGEQIVLLSPKQLELIIEDMTAAIDYQADWWTEGTDEVQE